MAVLVAYASQHGSTREIAERIAAGLRERGLPADVRPAASVTSLAGIEAAVVGSAIHNGDWLPEAADFLRRWQAELAGRPVWLFSVSCVGEDSSAFPGPVSRRMRAMAKKPGAVGAVWDLIRPRGWHAFAGAIYPGHWGIAGRAFMVAFGGRYGDHRNWPEIDRWIAVIANGLLAVHEPG